MSIIVGIFKKIFTSDHHAKMGGKPEFVKELEAKGIRGMAAVRYMMNEYKTNNQQLPGEKIYE